MTIDINNNILQIVPAKTDQELANEFKASLLEAMKPMFAICDEIHQAGFSANISWGIGPLGKTIITQLVISKTF